MAEDSKQECKQEFGPHVPGSQQGWHDAVCSHLKRLVSGIDADLLNS